jgi:hypothetical protein
MKKFKSFLINTLAVPLYLATGSQSTQADILGTVDLTTNFSSIKNKATKTIRESMTKAMNNESTKKRASISNHKEFGDRANELIKTKAAMITDSNISFDKICYEMKNLSKKEDTTAKEFSFLKNFLKEVEGQKNLGKGFKNYIIGNIAKEIVENIDINNLRAKDEIAKVAIKAEVFFKYLRHVLKVENDNDVLSLGNFSKLLNEKLSKYSTGSSFSSTDNIDLESILNTSRNESYIKVLLTDNKVDSNFKNLVVQSKIFEFRETIFKNRLESDYDETIKNIERSINNMTSQDTSSGSTEIHTETSLTHKPAGLFDQFLKELTIEESKKTLITDEITKHDNAKNHIDTKTFLRNIVANKCHDARSLVKGLNYEENIVDLLRESNAFLDAIIRSNLNSKTSKSVNEIVEDIRSKIITNINIACDEIAKIKTTKFKGSKTSFINILMTSLVEKKAEGEVEGEEKEETKKARLQK